MKNFTELASINKNYFLDIKFYEFITQYTFLNNSEI